MADRYWVGGTANWDGTAGTKWATVSGGAGGAAVPTTNDNVFFDAASGAGTTTITATANCANLDFTGYTGTLAGTGQFLNISGNLVLVAGMTLSFTGTMQFNSTATGKTVTTNGKTVTCEWLFSGNGGGWTLQDNLTMTGPDISLTGGTLDLNGKTISAVALLSSGAVTRTMTCGAATISLSGSTGLSFAGSGFTFNANTSTITLTANAGTFVGGGKTFNNVVFNGQTSTTQYNINDSNSFNNLTFTPGAAFHSPLAINGNQTVTGTLTLTGNSSANRAFFISGTLGTQRTITAAAVALTDVDFRDIDAAGAATPFTGTRLGNNGNNLDITFTAGGTKFWVAGTGNWTDPTNHWAVASGGAAGANNFPLPQDNVVFDNNSAGGNYTVTMPNAEFWMNDFTVSAPAAGNATIQQGGGGTRHVISGSLTIYATLSYVNGSPGIRFNATSTGKTITSNGGTLSAEIEFNGVGGGWTLTDRLRPGNQGVTLTAGALNASGQVMTMNNFTSTGSLTRSLDISNAQWSNSSSSLTWNVTATGFTLTVDTSTTLSGLAGTFNGAGLTYNDCTFIGVNGSAGQINGANTFRNLICNGPAAMTQLSINANQTITGTLTFTGSRADRRLRIFTATGIGNPFTLTAAAVSLTDVDFADITGAGAASPFTGTRLGDCKGNNGITFTAATPRFWVAGTGNWDDSTNHWANATGGAAGVNNYPLAQDSATFDANSFSAGAQTVTLAVRTGGVPYNLPSFDCSAISQAGIIFTGNVTAILYGNVVWKAGMAITGLTGTTQFSGRGLQTYTSAGTDFRGQFVVFSPGGTVRLLDSFLGTTSNQSIELQSGTLDLNGQGMTTFIFNSNVSTARTLTSGGATITVTANANTPIGMGNLTNFTLGDAAQFDLTYSGAAGTRTVQLGTTAGTEARACSVKVSAGTDTVTMLGLAFKNVDYTGFGGTLTNQSGTYYGNITYAAAMTISAGANVTTLAATSGTQTITSNGKTIDFPFTQNGAGGTVSFSDAFLLGITRAYTLTSGILDLNGKDVQAGLFASAGAVARTIKSSVGGAKLATGQTSAATVWNVSGSNLTVDRTDNNWSIEIRGNTANTRTFAGGGFTYPTVTFTNTTVNGRLNFTGSNTFRSIAFSGGTAQTIGFTAATTTTIETTNGFPTGSAGNVLTVASITAANHNLALTGGGVSTIINSDFMSISRSQATPAGAWGAGHNSTDGGNNSGWNFGTAFLCDRSEAGAVVDEVDNRNVFDESRIESCNGSDDQSVVITTNSSVAESEVSLEDQDAVFAIPVGAEDSLDVLEEQDAFRRHVGIGINWLYPPPPVPPAPPPDPFPVRVHPHYEE